MNKNTDQITLCLDPGNVLMLANLVREKYMSSQDHLRACGIDLDQPWAHDSFGNLEEVRKYLISKCIEYQELHRNDDAASATKN